MIRSILLASVLAFAAARADAITGADCTKPQHAQMIINHCTSLKFQAADAELRAVYEKSLAAIDNAPSRARFAAAQTAWHQFRDAQCAFEAGRYGGSRYSMAHSLCALSLTEQRTEKLGDDLACWQDIEKCGK